MASMLSVERTIIEPISTLSAIYFVYGVYMFLFGTYLYMTRKSEQRFNSTAATNTLYLRLAAVLFVLSTILLAIMTVLYVSDSIAFFDVVKTRDYRSLAKHLMPDNLQRLVPNIVANLVPILLNATADWMLIHRCYTIWSYDKRIGVPLLAVSLAVNVLGLISVILMLVGLMREGPGPLYTRANYIYAAYVISSAVVNAILTLLTAGRIWWMHRQVRAQGTQVVDKLVPSVCRIIIESGVLYPLFQFVAVVQWNTIDAPFNLVPIAALMAGIAPTIILARGKLGKNVESLQTGEALSDIQFNDQPGRVPDATGTQVQSVNIALTEVAVEAREKEGTTTVML